MNVELAEDFRFSTSARSGKSWPHNFAAWNVRADRKKREFTILADEPSEKEKGISIRLKIPFECVPSLVEAMRKSLSEEE